MKKRPRRKQRNRPALWRASEPDRRFRATQHRGYIVGVIASPQDFEVARRLPHPPDCFELRLDCLLPVLDQIERRISGLGAALIVTARDPREGGANNLSLERRRALLTRFLPHAKYLDVELRSARAFEPLLAQARKRNVRVILSFHDFGATPSHGTLCAKASQAKTRAADIFKVATRTDKPSELARLVDFTIESGPKIPISAMGIGNLGPISRLLLARCGSVLNYGSLKQANVEGQLPIAVLRSALPR